MRKAFDLGDGVTALIKAIELDPLWLFFGYDVEYLSRARARVRFTDCLAQKGSLRMEKDVFPCGNVDEGYFTSFAEAIDPRIRERRGFCPPVKYSDAL